MYQMLRSIYGSGTETYLARWQWQYASAASQSNVVRTWIYTPTKAILFTLRVVAAAR